MRVLRPDRRATGPAVCTIIARNYLAQARVLAKTYLQQHPSAPFFLLVVDGLPDGVYAGDGITVVDPTELGLTYFWEMSFKYDVTELSTAVKPSLLRLLFTKYGQREVMYIDPDIGIMRPMAELMTALQQHDIVLTPHTIRSIPLDGHLPTEQDILMAGAYNLGFIALRGSEAADSLVQWWEERLRDHCRVDPANGLMVDQKWIDLVPSMFPTTHILRDPTYNVAYWNLHERVVDTLNDGFTINGRPLTFFHFSGYNPITPDILSKHQTRHRLIAGSPLAKLFDRYRHQVLGSGYLETRDYTYRFSQFDNGVGLHALLRQLYLELDATTRERIGDPFVTTRRGSFLSWAVTPSARYRGLSPFLERVYRLRYDVACAFPDIEGADRDRFLRWARTSGVEEMRFDPRLAELGLPLTVEAPRDLDGDAGWTDRLPGVNVCGYLRNESGLGSATRGYVDALRHIGVDTALKDVSELSVNRSEDTSLGSFVESFEHRINLVCVNADQHFVVRNHDPAFFDGRYNIGVWQWELPEFPQDWYDRFDEYDELWVGTSFIANALAQVSPVPVIRIPPVVTPPPRGSRERGRAALGLSMAETVFLFIFDFNSYAARKNPVGLVDAFRRAFAPTDPVRLVIKSVNGASHPGDFARLQESAKGHAITLISDYLAREEVADLIEAADAYVSLHRSEGIGLTVAEAMTLGKPVIATAWSGNTDFMDVSNTFPVRYELIEIEEDVGPYRAGQVWADPSVDHAAELMRLTYEEPTEAKTRGERGRHDALIYFGRERISALIRQRLLVVDQRRRSFRSVERSSVPGFLYSDVVERIRSSAPSATEEGAVCAVISRGDAGLLELPGRTGWHFPQDETGEYAGYYPASSDGAIAHLEFLRTKGAGYLLVPDTARWWLEHYEAFRVHVESRYVPVLRDTAYDLFKLTPSAAEAVVTISNANGDGNCNGNASTNGVHGTSTGVQVVGELPAAPPQAQPESVETVSVGIEGRLVDVALPDPLGPGTFQSVPSAGSTVGEPTADGHTTSGEEMLSPTPGGPGSTDARVAALEARLAALEPLVSEMRHTFETRLERQRHKLHDGDVARDELRAAFHQQLGGVAAEVADLRGFNTALKVSVEELDAAQEEQRARFDLLHEWAVDEAEILRQRLDLGHPGDVPGYVLDATGDGPGPTSLARTRRTAETVVAARQHNYLRYFGDRTVTCLGASMEFVETLRLAGIRADHVLGPDASPNLEDSGCGRGLAGLASSSLSRLRDLDEAVLDDIFVSRFFEYLRPEELSEAFSLVGRRMRRQCRFVAEVLDPDSFDTWRAFHLDPTRTQPLFAGVAVQLCRDAGFASARIVRAGFDTAGMEYRRGESMYAVVALTG